MRGSIIGYDLNEKNCQISYYNEEQHEPETMEAAVDNYQIPLVIGNKEDVWAYGQEAKRLATLQKGQTVSRLLERAMNGERVQLNGEYYEAIWLLAKFIEMTLQSFEHIEYISFTVPQMGVDIEKMLKGIGQRMNIPKENIYVQDYKESFCHYMFYQPKELWQYEAALFYCDRREIRAYMLRVLKTKYGKKADGFVTVDEVAHAEMEELASVYPVLNIDKAKNADARFKTFIQSVFDKKIVSSVFLTGEGFENNWYPSSLQVLCNGRRAFLGNNLYSKGACYTAYRKCMDYKDGPIYLDDTKMTDQICLRVRINGEDQWYPIVPWGSRWYEADGTWEVLLEDTEDIEVHIESLASGELGVETISLDGLPKRSGYTLRLQIEVLFFNEKACTLVVKDMGFGEFFEATDFRKEITIRLGGNNGQFNSLS